MLYYIILLWFNFTKFYIGYLTVCNMLSAIWLSFKFHISAQSGFYIDYFYKKISEIFVKLIFVYMSQFFGEKFMIEVWTKKVFFMSINYINNFINITKLNYYWFFFHIIIVSFYLLSIIFFLSYII